MGKSQGYPTFCIPYWYDKAKNAVCQSRSTVCQCIAVCQCNHFTTGLQTSEFTQVSPFSSVVMIGHFSWYCFFNIWKSLFFTENGLAGAQSVDLDIPFLLQETFLHMVLWFYSVCSFVDGVFSSGNFRETSPALCLSHMRRALPVTKLHISVFHACAEHFQ